MYDRISYVLRCIPSPHLLRFPHSSRPIVFPFILSFHSTLSIFASSSFSSHSLRFHFSTNDEKETGNMTMCYVRDGDMDLSVTPTKNYPYGGILFFIYSPKSRKHAF